MEIVRVCSCNVQESAGEACGQSHSGVDFLLKRMLFVFPLFCISPNKTIAQLQSSSFLAIFYKLFFRGWKAVQCKQNNCQIPLFTSVGEIPYDCANTCCQRNQNFPWQQTCVAMAIVICIHLSNKTACVLGNKDTRCFAALKFIEHFTYVQGLKDKWCFVVKNTVLCSMLRREKKTLLCLTKD